VKRVLSLFPGLDVLRYQAGEETQYSHLTSPAFDCGKRGSAASGFRVAVLYGKMMSENCSNFGSRASQMLWFVANVFFQRI
jgi:hypothetical protein